MGEAPAAALYLGGVHRLERSVSHIGETDDEAFLIKVEGSDILRINRDTPSFRHGVVQVGDGFLDEKVAISKPSQVVGNPLCHGTDFGRPCGCALEDEGDFVLTHGDAVERLLLYAGRKHCGSKDRQGNVNLFHNSRSFKVRIRNKWLPDR